MHSYVRQYFRRLRLLAWNETEQRPRAFLRIYLFFVAYAIIFVAIPPLIAPSGSGLPRTAGLRAVLAISTVGLLFGAARFLDRKPVHTFGFNVDRQWMIDGFVGVLVGIAIPVIATLVGLVGGWLTLVKAGNTITESFLRDIGFVIVVVGCIAIAEEIVFRGYLLTNAIEGLDLRWLSPPITIASAWGVSALLFALTHPVPTLINGLHFLGAGFLLGLTYLLTGQLGLPIGLHAGFNFSSGYLFSTAQNPSVAVIRLTTEGPAWLTGQTGLVQTVLLVPAAISILGYVWWCSRSVGISLAIKAKIANRNGTSKVDR